MKPITTSKSLISYCGLYCGACKRYISGSCPGCAENQKASWCKIRSCNIEHGYTSCADCKDFANPMECKKFNNFISKIFAIIFKSDRAAGIAMIKESGYEGFAEYMATNRLQSVKRGRN